MAPQISVIRCVMPNVDRRIVTAQEKVLRLLMPAGGKLETLTPLGGWSTSGESHARMLNRGLRGDADIFILIDIDCIPLSSEILSYAISAASFGVIYGHDSFSAHIGDGKHRFVGPDFLAISRDTYSRLGCPSLSPTPRADVAEELTYLAEEADIPISRVLAQVYEERAPWTGDSNHGFGTTFGFRWQPLSYHMYGAREAPEHRIRRFVDKCGEVLKNA